MVGIVGLKGNFTIFEFYNDTIYSDYKVLFTVLNKYQVSNLRNRKDFKDIIHLEFNDEFDNKTFIRKLFRSKEYDD